MKLDRFYSRFRGNTVAGVFLQQIGEESSFTAVVLQKKDKGIVIESCWNDNDLTATSKKLPPHIPVFLVADGKGIVTRKINGNSAENVIGQIFPNFNQTEVSYFECGNFVSIARNDTLNEYVQQASQKGMSVTNLFIGTALVNDVHSLLEVKPTEIIVQTLSHQFENGQLFNISKTTLSGATPFYRLDGNELDGAALVAFSAALRYWMVNEIEDGIALASIETIRETHIYNLASRKIIPLLALPLFALLLLNFLFFNEVFDKNNQLKSRLNDYQSSISRYDTLKKEYDTRQDFVKKNNLGGHTRNAMYFDQIAVSKPNGIVFMKLENCPPTRKARKGEDPKFQAELLLVQGTVSSGQILNEWIKELRAFSWIADIKVNSFDMKENSTLSVFELSIQKKE